MPQEIACKPSDLLSIAPCMSCLSTKQMWSVLLYLMILESSRDLREELTIKKVMADSACWNCTTKTQRLQALITLLASGFEELSPETVTEEVKCLNCASESQIQAAIMYLFCRWWSEE